MRVIAGTGHRPWVLGGWNPVGWMPAVDALRQRLIQWACDEEDGITVITGMAAGFDLMLGAAALMARDEGFPVRLVAAIPYIGQEAKWSPSVQRWYHKIQARADEVQVLYPQPPSGREHATRLLLERNKWMVNASDELLACWNKKNDTGTGHTVAYARLQGKPILNVYEEVVEALRGEGVA